MILPRRVCQVCASIFRQPHPRSRIRTNEKRRPRRTTFLISIGHSDPENRQTRFGPPGRSLTFARQPRCWSCKHPLGTQPASARDRKAGRPSRQPQHCKIRLRSKLTWPKCQQLFRCSKIRLRSIQTWPKCQQPFRCSKIRLRSIQIWPKCQQPFRCSKIRLRSIRTWPKCQQLFRCSKIRLRSIRTWPKCQQLFRCSKIRLRSIQTWPKYQQLFRCSKIRWLGKTLYSSLLRHRRSSRRWLGKTQCLSLLRHRHSNHCCSNRHQNSWLELLKSSTAGWPFRFVACKRKNRR